MTENSLVERLEPCPFCGGAAEWNTGRTGDDKPWRYIACEACEAMGPHLVEPNGDAAKVASWNRRAEAAERALASKDGVREAVVKALTWVERPIFGGESRIMTLDGRYWISKTNDGFMVIRDADEDGHVRRLGGDERIVFPTLEDAKAAAQAHFEAFIRSALTTPPPAQDAPVGGGLSVEEARRRLIEGGSDTMAQADDGIDRLHASLEPSHRPPLVNTIPNYPEYDNARSKR